MMVTEAEAIKRVQMPAGDESERMVGKARGDREAAVAHPLRGKRADWVIVDEIAELHRLPAPWCPKPWSKSSRPSLPPHEGEG